MTFIFTVPETTLNPKKATVSVLAELTSDHVLDEITMSWGVNDGNVVLCSLELPEGNVDRDTTFTLGLQFVEHPGVLEGTFAHLLSFLLEFLDRTLVDTTAFVDQMSSSGRLSGVDMSDDDDVNMHLFLAHSCRAVLDPN